MKQAKIHLIGTARYSQSRPHVTMKKPKETAQDYEGRTWANRLHVNDDGHVYVPAITFRNCLSECAKFLSLQIPGKGKMTYTKHFESGILTPYKSLLIDTKSKLPIVPPSENGLLKAALQGSQEDISPDQVKQIEGWERASNEVFGDWVFVPADGVAGSGKRVWKCYPIIENWECDITVFVSDDTITEDVFKKVLMQAGTLIGIGRWRVRNRGNYGTFRVDSIEWSTVG